VSKWQAQPERSPPGILTGALSIKFRRDPQKSGAGNDLQSD
jgi:hypothetical protein